MSITILIRAGAGAVVHTMHAFDRHSLYARFLHLENRIHHRLVLHSITWLRLAVGAIFFGFGILKYFNGVSPAQNLTEATTHILFLGLIPGDIAIRMIATLECVIGLCLLTNRCMRLAVWLLAIEFIGILSPLILLPGREFAGPYHAPTLEGQYCLKDIILVTAALVIAAGTFRGGRLIRADLPPSIRASGEGPVDPEHKLRIVLDGIGDSDSIATLCEQHHVTESDFYQWRDQVIDAARLALETSRDDSNKKPTTEPALRV